MGKVELWKVNSIQFPRLLAELRAAGLTTEQYEKLQDSMDLDLDEIEELFDRAQEAWEEHKKDRTPPPNVQSARERIIAIQDERGWKDQTLLDVLLDLIGGGIADEVEKLAQREADEEVGE